jgi:ribosomal-protein-alanine N-acetyltransferase
VLPIIPADSDLYIQTPRLILEPVQETHASELCLLFSDAKLHEYVPSEIPTLQQQLERCRRWAKRISPDGKEIWLNWAAREISNQSVVGHFQAGIKEKNVASIGYTVNRNSQGKGFATEAMSSIIQFLRKNLAVQEVKAWSDTRNVASHCLAKKLGMTQIELIKNADFFKGQNSDEFVFSIEFKI